MACGPARHIASGVASFDEFAWRLLAVGVPGRRIVASFDAFPGINAPVECVLDLVVAGTATPREPRLKTGSRRIIGLNPKATL